MTTGFWILVSLAVLLGVAGVVLVFVVLRQRRTVAGLRRQLNEFSEVFRTLERERPTLANMVRQREDDETRQLIRHRYNLLGNLLAAAVSGEAERHDEILDEVDGLVADRDEFMRQTRLIYERLQPGMTEHLRGCGLTDREVEICCLYALGLNGKTIQKYTRDGRHFQNVGLIRKKLGLGEHDRNIDGYIRSLLK